MHVDDLKRWHWVVIGTCLGFIVGYLQTVVGYDPLRALPRALEQRKFEEELHQAIQGRPKLKDLRVYRDGSLLLVKFQRLALMPDGRTFAYGEWQMTPPVPYKPQIGPKAIHDANYTVLNYLAEQAGRDASIHFYFAWWATKPMTVLIWTVGGLVVIGGVWPTVVNLLIGAGFGRAALAESDYDLSHFKTEKDLLPQTVPTDGDDQKLRDLEAEMIRNLEGSQTTPQVAMAASSSPVVALNAGSQDPVAPANAEEDKKFAGQFYPVTHGVQKKPSNSSPSAE